MVPDLHRQTLKQQKMPQVNILKNFKVKDVCTCPNSWLRASDCVPCKMVLSSIPNGVDAKGLKNRSREGAVSLIKSVGHPMAIILSH